MEHSIIASILAVLGFCLFILGEYLKKLHIAGTAKFTELVNAKVVDLKDAGPLDRGNKVLYPTLRYTYAGKTYRTKSNEFVNSNVKTGDVFSIFIDPNSPQNICLVKNGGSISSIAAKVIGAFLIFFGIVVYLLLC